MKRLLLFVSVALMGSLPCFPQSADKETSLPRIDVFPKSPEVTAMERFGNIPVGLSTGVPGITVPIWNIKLKSLSIPVSLGYHSSGNKVNDMASTVGLGWALNAGGSVSENVNGLPDLGINGGNLGPGYTARGWLNVSSKTPQTGTIRTEVFNAPDPIHIPDDPEFVFAKESAEGKVDTEPDLFSISYLGQSLKFYFDQDKQIHLMPYKRVKISMTATGFNMLDENDNLFEFSTMERSTTYTNTYSMDYVGKTNIDITASYLLSKITTPAGEVVRFTYTPVGYSFDSQVSETRYAMAAAGCAGFMPQPRKVLSSTALDSRLIETIVSSTGDSVRFSYSYAREDISGAATLTSVNVFNRSTLIKSYSLSHDYFVSPTLNTPVAADKRLRLLSVTEAGKGPYIFSYDGTPLPKRFSFAQDHWGYFNQSGNDENAVLTLLPVDAAHGFTTGANREPTLAGTMAGVLTSVKYPTGGTSTFSYELNDMFGTQYVEIPTPVRLQGGANISGVKIVPFSIPSGAYDVKAYFVTTSEPMEGLESNFGTSTVIKILQGTAIIRQFSGSDEAGVSVPFGAGSYTARICPDPNEIGVYLKLTWKMPGEETTQAVSYNMPVGGLRVAQTADYTESGAEPLITKYEYRKFDQPNVSSGTRGAVPEYVYTHNVGHYIYDLDAVLSCDYAAQSSGSLISLSSVQGGNVFYDQVRVYKKDKTSYGYTDTKFFTGFGSAGGSFRYPFVADIGTDWLDGLETERTSYRYVSTTGQFTPVSKTQNTYKTSNGPSATGPNESYVRAAKITVYRQIMFSSQGPMPIQYPVFDCSHYYLTTSWTYPTRTVETIFDPQDSTKKTVVTKDFYYENPLHAEMTRQEVSRSDGSQTVEKMRYPLDYNTAYAYNSSPLVERRQIVKRDNTETLVGADLTLYRSSAGSFPLSYYRLSSAGPLDPSSIPLYSGGSITSGFEKRLDYAYDPSNNLELSTEGEVKKSSYQWGYGGTYPVAVCSNADRTEFYAEDFEENGTPGNAHTGKMAYIGASYTVNWTRPNARDYRIGYFFLSASGWRYQESPYPSNSFVLSGGTAYDGIRIFPSDAQMTTFTHEPLVGMTSQTDAKGLTSYYEYDAFQRLMAIKDQNGHIVTSYDYHFKP